MPKTSLLNREIFSIGTWRGSRTVAVDSAMLDDMVSSFNSLAPVGGFDVPIKLGHNKRIGEPAFGWVQNLRREGDVVLADFMDMDPVIVEQVEQKRYNAVSVEIWPEVEYGGKTFTNVLGGIALLGAEWPAVKGLKRLATFSADNGIQLSKEENDVTTFTQEQHDALVTAAEGKLRLEMQSQIDEQTQRADRAEVALCNFTEAAEKAEITAVIEAAEKAGKIVPANKQSVLDMAEAVRTSVDPAKRKAVLSTFSAFVENLPVKVQFSEQGRSNAERPGDGERAGDVVDQRAKAKMAAKADLSYRDALDAVFAEDPDLKTRYAQENR